jgi:hypothetical protein
MKKLASGKAAGVHLIDLGRRQQAYLAVPSARKTCTNPGSAAQD